MADYNDKYLFVQYLSYQKCSTKCLAADMQIKSEQEMNIWNEEIILVEVLTEVQSLKGSEAISVELHFKDWWASLQVVAFVVAVNESWVVSESESSQKFIARMRMLKSTDEVWEAYKERHF